MLIYIKQWQQKVKPQPGANPLMVILSWLLFGMLLLIGLAMGLMLLLFGWILLLPLMWRKRRQMKQMWQFTKATREAQKQAQQQYQQQREHQRNRQDDGVIEGEYEVKDDDTRPRR
ncbi:hypothetical protein EGC76_02620 [Pseudidiomarina gelatinasegens]|mgnify:CR=1 FL=1|jgi:H+/gluconate symporter-like permease|uniref:Uncharacterized protein n=1 Tax=Pseudidiomarina gelatinasegens TaxID=2487740 RepID=A0A443Z5T0_9GAMM|nr:hypothetical protein [Pseudidiomarina gelatinasegens]RWU12104.1 hypothetical protein EGC76_02620 [Pseudidiomarina gelatinasegens]